MTPPFMKIGPHTLANPWLLAPIAGATDMPYRRIARECGAAAAVTELVSATGLVKESRRTERYLARAPGETPFWVQLFGNDPEEMAAGAVRAVELGAEIIDVNMGCPVPKVTRNGAGSALHLNIERAAQIVAAIVARVSVPVTVKMRTGWDATQLNFLELAAAVQDAGCAAMTLHARTRAQGYSGLADWSCISRLVEAARVPVIGNGDASTPERARRMLAETGCAAVMIGRAALGNPWIFRRLVEPGYVGPSAEERWQIVHEHLLAHVRLSHDEAAQLRSFRPQLMWYARGLSGASEFRRRVTRLENLIEVLVAAEAFFRHAD